jgi:hypothetical protein
MPFGFGDQWIKTQGVVVASRDIGSKALGTWRKEWAVEVHAPDGEVFRSTIKWPFSDRGFWPVSEGETISIEYNPKNHEVRWDKSDPNTNLFAKTPASEKARQDQAFNDALAGRTPAAAPAASDPDMAGLDPELQELYRSQLQQQGGQAAVAPASAPAAAPAADGKIGLEFQFDADGRPAAGQVQNVVGAVASGQMRTIRGKADELLATGTHGTAVVTSAAPLGKTVRDINPNADPSRLNDPMWLFTVEVTVAGENPFPAVFGHRVPLAKLVSVGPGMRLAVAVNMADRNNEVAIDWDRSPLGQP